MREKEREHGVGGSEIERKGQSANDLEMTRDLKGVGGGNWGGVYCNININDGGGGGMVGGTVWLVIVHLHPSLHPGAHLIAAPPDSPKKLHHLKSV